MDLFKIECKLCHKILHIHNAYVYQKNIDNIINICKECLTCDKCVQCLEKILLIEQYVPLFNINKKIINYDVIQKQINELKKFQILVTLGSTSLYIGANFHEECYLLATS